jgi:23S rRNA (cytidine1920-2'-O)/16S rRNA (cytidine1409-2'-O)-methyltransferase
MTRTRLDVAVHERGLAESRERARRLILSGEVTVNGQPVSQPSSPVQADAAIGLRQGLPHVSRGGLKLARALEVFGVSPLGWVAADVGASTGGFTDCLLQAGAQRVYAIDVGYGQLAWTLRQDPRVVVMERTNARYLEALPEPVQLVTIDVSFISLRLILPQAGKWLAPCGQLIALVKPQFEAGAGQVGKGGVVRDSAVHRRVLTELLGWAVEQGWRVAGLTCSPVRGPKGNVEFLAWLHRADGRPTTPHIGLIEQTLRDAESL